MSREHDYSLRAETRTLERGEFGRVLSSLGHDMVAAKAQDVERYLCKIGLYTNHDVAEVEMQDLTDAGLVKLEAKCVLRFIHGGAPVAAPILDPNPKVDPDSDAGTMQHKIPAEVKARAASCPGCDAAHRAITAGCAVAGSDRK